MSAFGFAALGVAAFVAVYPYLIYPVLLRVRGGDGGARGVRAPEGIAEWPAVSVAVPVHNERAQIRELLDSLRRVEYPRDRLQILMISDASTDGTDEIIREYGRHGVELFRLPVRAGKTEAENAARHHLRGEIIVNTDASVRIDPGAVKALVAALDDPTVGVASGRDVSVDRAGDARSAGEAGYVGFEMWVRSLENGAGGIVGASGCLYAIRSELHRLPVPGELSRDFISVLNTRERGFRSLSVEDAICYVPRTPSLLREYRRKVRTLTRGMATLRFKRRLLNPLYFGAFSWMLLSHKVVRWLLPWAGLLGFAGMMALSFTYPAARGGLVVLGAGLLLAALPWIAEARGSRTASVPRALMIPAYIAGSTVAAGHAALRVLAGRMDPVWEPTRREGGAQRVTTPQSDPT